MAANTQSGQSQWIGFSGFIVPLLLLLLIGWSRLEAISTVPRSTPAATSIISAATVTSAAYQPVETELQPKPLAVADELDGEEVRKSIQRGVRYLLSKQNGDRWTCAMNYPGGGTALVALALLNSGVPADSPEMVRVINYLTTLEARQTYVSSLIIMVLAEADPQKYRVHIRRHAEYLIGIQMNGGFGYGTGRMGGDGSNSQFAILGLHAAQSAGVDIDEQVWIDAKAYWEGVFNRRSSGFGYTPGASSTGSMTCAGICSLTIIEENLAEGSSRARGNSIECCQTDPRNPMIEDGINWLGRNFSVLRNPAPMGDAHVSAVFYYLYSLERAGRLTGRRFFGQHDWYREGTAAILKKQRLDGSWLGSQFMENERPLATAMALLFLSKGLRPILIGKYEHSSDDWDPHPQGIQYLTRFVEKTWERKLNWQTIDAANATANDLLESPVLHITGKSRLKLTANQIENLKTYIDNGGFLFFESENGFDCPDARLFDQDVRNLLAILFPDAKLEVLKPDHMVWTAQFRLKPNQDFPLLGIQSCCRTSVIYCPAPISGVWQLNRPKSDRYTPPVRETIDYSLKLGTNILAFATGNELKDKLDRPKLDLEAGKNNRNVGRRILVPKLKHGAGYDDAPMALSNLLRRVENDRGIQFQNKTEFVDADLEQLVYYPIVFVHGRGTFRLSPEEREALKKHLERDGFIFGDAICGDQAFYESFKREMQDLAGGPTWEKVTSTDALLSKQLGGYDLTKVELRIPQDGVTRTVETVPRLEALRFADKYRVIFSQYDISCALENGTSSSCYGYTVDDASRIATNILLYALQP